MKTVEDVLKEAEPRKEISNKELNWALNYERSLLDKNVRYPKDGEIFEAKSDVEVYCCIYCLNPSSSGVDCIIPKGTRVIVRYYKDNKPLMVDVIPINYDQIDKLVVPKEERNAHKYAGYNLSTNIDALNKEFSLCENLDYPGQ